MSGFLKYSGSHKKRRVFIADVDSLPNGVEKIAPSKPEILPERLVPGLIQISVGLGFLSCIFVNLPLLFENSL